MDFIFKALTENHHLFFDILPQDWQDEIVPYWKDHMQSSNIYVLSENDEIIGGGIVFSNSPPDILNYADEAQQWFENGFLYLGFIYVEEHKRGHNLGSVWLEELKKYFPKQKYWLLIEDEGLHGFYQKNGFVLMKTLTFKNQKDWLYSFEPTEL